MGSSFYTDENGKLKRYYKCSLCMKGTYKKEDIGIHLFNIAGDLKYCSECMIAHRYKIPESAKIKPVIVSEKGSEEKGSEEKGSEEGSSIEYIRKIDKNNDFHSDFDDFRDL